MHAYPRTLHVDRCGDIALHNDAAESAACNVSADLELFARGWVRAMLEGDAP